MRHETQQQDDLRNRNDDGEDCIRRPHLGTWEIVTFLVEHGSLHFTSHLAAPLAVAAALLVEVGHILGD